MKINNHLWEGRTFIDVVDLIRVLQSKGNQIVTKDLIDQLWALDENGQASKHRDHNNAH